MSKAYLIDSSQNLINVISNLILSENLGHTTVIFPNRRPAIFLSKSLASKKNKALGSIELFSIDDFVDNLYETYTTFVYPEISTLEAVFLIFDINKKISFVNIDNIDYFWPWGFKLYSDFEELYLEQVDLASIDYLIQNNLPSNLTNFPQRISRFSNIYSQFYEALEKKGFSTRSIKYKQASLYSKKYKQENVIFAGFYDLTKTERELFANILDNTNGFFVSKNGPKITDLLSKLKIKDIVENNQKEKKPIYHFIKAPYLHNQIYKLKELKNELNGFRDDDLIVLSNESYLFPIIHNFIDINTDTFNISIGYPLYRTPIVSLLDALLNLHKRSQDAIYIKDYLNVIFHPYIKSLKLNSIDLAAKIYGYTVKNYFANLGVSFVLPKDLEDDLLILETIKKLKQHDYEIANTELVDFVKLVNDYIIGNFLNIKDIGDFLDKITLLIEFLQKNSNVSLNAIESRYIESMLENLLELSSLSIKNYKLNSIVSYFNLLKNFLKTKNVSFPSDPQKGFQILGSLETRNLTFNRVFYLGVNEGIIPHLPKQETILTDDIRKILNLSTSKDRLDMQKYNFFNLASGANEVFFFYETSQDKNKSRFLEDIFWQVQKQEKNLDVPVQEDAMLDVTFAQNLPPKIKNSSKVQDILFWNNFYFTASSIDTFLSCKAKFYFSHILQLQETFDDDDLNPISIGNLSHKVLYNYFKHYRGKNYEPKDCQAELEAIYQLIDNEIPKPSKSVWLQKEQIKYAMKKFFEHNFFTITNRTIEDLEFPLETNILVNEKIFRIRGRLDKLDKINNQFIIVDYKTGLPKEPKIEFLPLRENRDQWLRNIKSFQLPIYSFLLKNAIGAQSIKFEFWGLKDSQIKSFDINDELLGAYEDSLKIIINEIIACDFFDYTEENIENLCSNCPYKVICARHFVTRNW